MDMYDGGDEMMFIFSYDEYREHNITHIYTYMAHCELNDAHNIFFHSFCMYV